MHIGPVTTTTYKVSKKLPMSWAISIGKFSPIVVVDGEAQGGTDVYGVHEKEKEPVVETGKDALLYRSWNPRFSSDDGPDCHGIEIISRAVGQKVNTWRPVRDRHCRSPHHHIHKVGRRGPLGQWDH